MEDFFIEATAVTIKQKVDRLISKITEEYTVMSDLLSCCVVSV